MAEVVVTQEMLDAFTVGDIEDIEELGGLGFAAFTSGSGVTMRAMRAFAYVTERRTKPEVQFESYRELTLRQLVALIDPEQPLGKLQQPKASVKAKRARAA